MGACYRAFTAPGSLTAAPRVLVPRDEMYCDTFRICGRTLDCQGQTPLSQLVTPTFHASGTRAQLIGRAADGERISVGFPGDEQAPSAYIVVDDGPCERIQPPERWVPDLALWSTFVGAYRLPDRALVADPNFTVALDGDYLTLTWRGTTAPASR